MAESQDASSLKRRARRRLVGAIALVVFLVIVLPIVLEKEPKPVSQDLVIQIPSQDAGRFSTRILPPPAAEKSGSSPGAAPSASPAKSPPKAETKSAAPKAEAGSAAPKEEKSTSRTDLAVAAAREADAKRAQAILEGESFVIPLGAFTQSENIKHLQAKLTAGGIKSFTETLQGPRGEQTRVRAGPFETRDAAERAREKLKAMGIDPGPVTQR